MNDLTEALYHTVADKWEHIGIYLHLPMPTLKTIAAEHQQDFHKCLIGMLGVWLKRVDPPPTWTAIIGAVEFLGKEQLARQPREKYCPQIYEMVYVQHYLGIVAKHYRCIVGENHFY